MQNSNTKGLIWGLIALIIVIIGIVWAMGRPSTDSGQAGNIATTTTNGQPCTQEALICPDGSTVGRTGPNCQFAACPTASSTATSTLKHYTDPSTGVKFDYPTSLGTTYIGIVDWPPKVQVLSGTRSCTAAGTSTEPAGMTQSKVVNGHTYCVTIETQGAAGSIYNSYAYAFAKAGPAGSGVNKTVILTFSLRYPQCGNYEDPNQTACKREEASFNIDKLVDTIATSVVLP